MARRAKNRPVEEKVGPTTTITFRVPRETAEWLQGAAAGDHSGRAATLVRNIVEAAHRNHQAVLANRPATDLTIAPLDNPLACVVDLQQHLVNADAELAKFLDGQPGWSAGLRLRETLRTLSTGFDERVTRLYPVNDLGSLEPDANSDTDEL